VWLGTEEGQAALQRVLLAFSVHNARVGYCQSMNFVAGMLLLVMEKNEESAFWLMVALLDGGSVRPRVHSSRGGASRPRTRR
jgi:TBC1 domain family member 2A